MRVFFSFFSFVYIFYFLLIFYFIGIDRFPDYENYLVIARYGGITGEKDYWFEWISRFLLSFDLVDPHSRVLLTTIVNQIFCVAVLFYFCKKSERNAIGMFLIVAIFYFLFLTTTIRASAAYLAAGIFFVEKTMFSKKSILLLIFALAWHDTAIILFLILMLTGLFCLFFRNSSERKLNYILNFIVLLALFLLFNASGILSSFLGLLELGSRLEYFIPVEEVSLVKTFYFLFLAAILFGYLRAESSLEKKVFLCIFFSVMCAASSFNQVMGIRFSYYLIIFFLLDQGGFFKNMKMNYGVMFLSPFVCMFNVYGVLNV